MMGRGDHQYQCRNVKITVDIPKGTKFSRKPFISNSWVRAEVRDKLLHLPFHSVSRRLDPFRFRVSETLTNV